MTDLVDPSRPARRPLHDGDASADADTRRKPYVLGTPGAFVSGQLAEHERDARVLLDALNAQLALPERTYRIRRAASQLAALPNRLWGRPAGYVGLSLWAVWAFFASFAVVNGLIATYAVEDNQRAVGWVMAAWLVCTPFTLVGPLARAGTLTEPRSTWAAAGRFPRQLLMWAIPVAFVPVLPLEPVFDAAAAAVGEATLLLAVTAAAGLLCAAALSANRHGPLPSRDELLFERDTALLELERQRAIKGSGISTEEAVGETLEQLEGVWAVVHEAQIGRLGDADHVVIGPAVAVIESKSGRGEVSCDSTSSPSKLIVNGTPLRGASDGPVGQVLRAAAAVSTQLQRPTVPIVCVARMSNRTFETPEGVWVTSVNDLPMVIDIVMAGARQSVAGREIAEVLARRLHPTTNQSLRAKLAGLVRKVRSRD